MSTFLTHKYKWAIGVFSLALITGSYLINPTGDINSEPKLEDKENLTNSEIISSEITTIAAEWQWQEAPIVAENSDQIMFTEQSVYDALQNVRLNEQGNLIIDHETLLALNATLDDSRLQLDGQDLTDLTEIIKQSLPGSAGIEVADIVENYYEYLDAERTYNSIYANEFSSIESANIEEYQDYYQELITLREVYLGSETAENLFSTTDANANYMFDMLKITQSTDLSEEEKKLMSDELNNSLATQTIDIDNWDLRYNAFLSAKEYIINAEIDEQQKRNQVVELMHQHFNNEELAVISHLSLDEI